MPEVGLVAILDADKEGFLRNARGLIQMAGRAARSLNGEVVLYADKKTDSIKKFIEETSQRRLVQRQFNKDNNITPRAIQKPIKEFRISSDSCPA